LYQGRMANNMNLCEQKKFGDAYVEMGGAELGQQ
jgi:hypothetical protein